MRSWLALLACAGCGRLDFGALDARDAPGITDSVAPCTFGPWSTPTDETELNTVGDDWAADVTDRGLTIYFVSDRSGGIGGFDIWRATRASTTQPFGNLTDVVELDTVNDDFGPDITIDGLTMYYATDNQARDLFVATRSTTAGAFGGITRLASVDSTGVDDAPSITDDGLTLLFRSDRAGNSDVYIANRDDVSATFGAPRNVLEVDSGVVDEGTFISADGLTILWGSNRTGGPGNMDIYTATRADRSAMFSAAQLVPELSSTSNDDDLDLSDDGGTIYFSSDRPGGLGGEDIWTATRSCL